MRTTRLSDSPAPLSAMVLLAMMTLLATMAACGGPPGAERSTSTVISAAAPTSAAATLASAPSTATPTQANTSTAPSTTAAVAPTVSSVVPARQWVEVVEAIVRTVKPTPPEAARIYAYATTAYADALDAGATTAEAARAVVAVMRALRPDSAGIIDAAAEHLGAQPSIGTGPNPGYLLARVYADGFTTAPAPDRPLGDGLWTSKTAKAPLSPSAGGWQRWVVTGFEADVAAPPGAGSAEQTAELTVVRRAVAGRDARWVDRINHWGGAPGTNTPAGIWLDELWNEIADTPLGSDDHRVARLQSDLARTMADAFIETWRVKYTYWTARPDMLDPTLTTAMPDPNFPSYVSGHSTVSAAAATVLAALVPEKANVWIADAEEARDTRLMAGIHFPVDNEEGFRLGHAVGEWALVAFAADLPAPSTRGPVEPRPSRLSLPASVGVSVSTVDLTTPLVDDPVGSGRLALRTSRTSPGPHDGPAGALVTATKSGSGRSFVVALNASDADHAAAGAGWSVTRLSTDPMWAPAACGGAPTAIVGSRWITYTEVQPDDAGQPAVRLVAFDLSTRTFTSYLPVPNDVAYTGSLWAADDHHVDVGYTLAPAGGGASSTPVVDPIVRVRRIDLRDGRFDDLRPRPQPVTDAVDGVTLRYSEGNPDVDLVGGGYVVASIHAYRQVRLFGWAAPFAYVSGFDGDSEAAPGSHGVGVYDSRTATWDWGLVATPDSSLLALGVIAR